MKDKLVKTTRESKPTQKAFYKSGLSVGPIGDEFIVPSEEAANYIRKHLEYAFGGVSKIEFEEYISRFV